MPYADPEMKRANDRRYYLENREARMAYIRTKLDCALSSEETGGVR